MKRAPLKSPSVAPRPSRRDLPLVLLLIVVLGFAALTVIAQNSLRLTGTVDRMSCAMTYGSKAMLISTDQFDLNGKPYDLSAQADRPSLHPLCLVPIALVHNDESKGEYTDGQGHVYVALDLAAVDRDYSAVRDLSSRGR